MTISSLLSAMIAFHWYAHMEFGVLGRNGEENGSVSRVSSIAYRP
jgi:hypothetical protein